jgi:hypothetical protein
MIGPVADLVQWNIHLRPSLAQQKFLYCKFIWINSAWHVSYGTNIFRVHI